MAKTFFAFRLLFLSVFLLSFFNLNALVLSAILFVFLTLSVFFSFLENSFPLPFHMMGLNVFNKSNLIHITTCNNRDFLIINNKGVHKPFGD